VTIAKTLRGGDRQGDALQVQKRVDVPALPVVSLFSAIADGRVLHRSKRTRIKPATITGYKSAIEWMSPHIGKVPLANIKNAAAKEFLCPKLLHYF
jgi:hypothetical protein